MWPFKKSKRMGVDYAADGLGVQYKSTDFMEEPAFENAWNYASSAAEFGWSMGVPDIRWRVHIALWAAQNGSRLEGDFVECGVYTGILSLSICHYLQFQNINKSFWLYDTWDGIPLEKIEETERESAETLNEIYKNHDVFESTKKAFEPYPNTRMIRGSLPDTLDQGPGNISYLSIDLNSAQAEKDCIEALWSRLTHGAIVLIDDYGWKTHETQRLMWDEFAVANGHTIANLPTGQGVLIKTK